VTATDRPTIALRALEHYGYCPRQCALIHVDGVWADNEHTVKGQAGHKRADTAPPRHERGRLVVRGMELWSDSLSLLGRADAVEFSPDGTIEPVEYKIGTPHGRSAEMQLCAQAFCLEEMFDISVQSGAIWYSGIRKRLRVEFNDELRELTTETIENIRALTLSPTLPEAPNDARCAQCQLLGHCTPNLVSDPAQIVNYFQTQVLACES
jgi:CRISPR-associated exonuclease Cas4